METEKMELRLINPNESGFLQHIEWNCEEIRNQVQTLMSAYTDVVYTEDTMKSAKDDRATLNKFKAAIEDRRKEVKRKCLEPYEQFEKEVKEIVSLIDEPIGMIDGQIKDYEENQKADKKAKIQKAYDEAIGNLADVFPFDKAFDSRYLNKSYSLKNAVADIQEKIKKVRTDLDTIDGLDSKYRLNVKDVYVQTFDLSKAMAEDKRLKELEERLEADRKAKEEAEKKRLEAEAAKHEEMEKQRAEAQRQAEEKKSEPESVSSQPQSENSIAHQTPEEAVQQEKRYKATFWCKGTLEQIKALGDYMRANNIEFGKVEK